MDIIHQNSKLYAFIPNVANYDVGLDRMDRVYVVFTTFVPCSIG